MPLQPSADCLRLCSSAVPGSPVPAPDLQHLPRKAQDAWTLEWFWHQFQRRALGLPGWPRPWGPRPLLLIPPSRPSYPAPPPSTTNYCSYPPPPYSSSCCNYPPGLPGSGNWAGPSPPPPWSMRAAPHGRAGGPCPAALLLGTIGALWAWVEGEHVVAHHPWLASSACADSTLGGLERHLYQLLSGQKWVYHVLVGVGTALNCRSSCL